MSRCINSKFLFFWDIIRYVLVAKHIPQVLMAPQKQMTIAMMTLAFTEWLLCADLHFIHTKMQWDRHCKYYVFFFQIRELRARKVKWHIQSQIARKQQCRDFNTGRLEWVNKFQIGLSFMNIFYTTELTVPSILLIKLE